MFVVLVISTLNGFITWDSTFPRPYGDVSQTRINGRNCQNLSIMNLHFMNFMHIEILLLDSYPSEILLYSASCDGKLGNNL